jgi:hypothetical protein
MRGPVQLVLDATAIHTYPSIDVGEIIAVMNDDGERFGVSVVALASTSALLGDGELGVLTTNTAFSELQMAGGEWRRLGAMMRRANDVAVAHAALVARDHGCPIMTACPELYVGIDDPPIFVIEN